MATVTIGDLFLSRRLKLTNNNQRICA